MSSYGERLSGFLEEALQKPGATEILKEWCENTLTHHNNPLYAEASRYWLKVQADQINKGAAKYRETLNPKSWSLEQLVEHAMQENVDQAHYLTALKTKGDEMARRLELLVAAEKALQTIAEAADRQEPWKVAEVATNAAKGFFMVKELVMQGKWTRDE